MQSEEYLHFCGGETLKNREVKIILTPDVDYKLGILAKEKEISVEKYIYGVLREHAYEHSPSRKTFDNLFK